MLEYISQSIEDSISLKKEFLSNPKTLSEIERVGMLLYNSLTNGNKILLCGNGGSAADSQHIAAEFVGRFTTNRIALPAIALTTDTSILTAVGNDYGFDYIFERQIEALANKNDVLIVFTTSGNSQNIKNALRKAISKGVKTIGLLGGDGGVCKQYCNHHFIVNSSSSARVQELHIMIGHILCGIVDKKFDKNE